MAYNLHKHFYLFTGCRIRNLQGSIITLLKLQSGMVEYGFFLPLKKAWIQWFGFIMP